ncbi:hypothetical protein CAEBREN_02505 [Caenorhabditis brenneri]|uniref:F-box domain-containing protein n=1 Tax=Caenorhabditis brenneri TaxID=135651 RepID=G0NQP6_CAEBE|nr:hypothetical protein CAEBREN_02505 [Caenorhabditis brenneri]
MSEFFKSNPMALRHCLLYKFLQKNAIEQVYSVFCMVIGYDVIKKEDFYSYSNQFDRGVFDINDDRGSITDMRDVLRSDKYALRACILYESLKYELTERVYKTLWPKSNSLAHKSNPIFSIYNYFCKVIGDDVMDYREFEFWFYRFLNGDFDLNYVRDKDKKTYELMDMPVVVMKNIVEYLDIFDRMKLAKTSQSLQTFVEDTKLLHHTLKLNISPYMATISFSSSVCIKYIREGKDCVKNYKKRETLIQNVSYWKQAFLDFKHFLKNPKLHLNTFFIESDVDNENVFDDLEDTLKFTHFLSVKNVFLVGHSWELLAKILPVLKPGYLKTINIDSHNPNVDSMEKVFETKQWKQAKYFKMDGACFIWPLRNLYHFKEVTIRLEKLSLEDVREMKEVLFNSSDFEKCSMAFSREIDMSVCEQEFGNLYHSPAPNSTDYFKIKVEDHHFEVTRRKR